MLNYIWLGLMVLAVVVGGINGQLDQVVTGGFNTARSMVMDIALPLVAIMVIWLGLMRLAERAGWVSVLARALRPILRWLFPEVPADHPAMGSMVMNIAANMLGLGNAATPLGLRAMADLQTLNPAPGTATNAMCTFLAINTASIQLIPATAIGILAVAGSKNPTVIVGSAILATICAQIVGLTAVKALEKLPMFRLRMGSTGDLPVPSGDPPDGTVATPRTIQNVSNTNQPSSLPVYGSPALPIAPLTAWGKALLILFVLFFAYLFVALMCPGLGLAGLSPETVGSVGGGAWIRTIKTISLLAVPFLLAFFPLYAALRGIKVFEEFVEGGKEGFPVILKIIPYIVAMMAAVGMFRAAGGIAMLASIFAPVLQLLHVPPEILSLAFLRPLSGSGSIAVLSDIVKTYGPDHLNSLTAATILGSTETTFYVLAVYFGSVGIRRTRHAVIAGLLADTAGILASIVICRWMFAEWRGWNSASGLFIPASRRKAPGTMSFDGKNGS